MRGLLVALCLIVAPLAGCMGLGGSSVSIQEATPPDDVILTYEVIQHDETRDHAFLAQERPEGGTDLLAYNTTEDFSSPFLRLDGSLQPRGYDWSGLLPFPLDAGDAYTATVENQEVHIELEATTFDHANRSHDALRLIATDEDQPRLELTILQEPTLLAEIHFTPEQGASEAWTLLDAEHAPDWNDLPQWTIGDWWRYDATTVGEHADATMIYNENRTNNQGSQQRVLNQKEVESRPVALPFQVFLDRNLAPQAGMLNAMMSTFWGEWPMHEGDSWTGNSNIVGTYETHVERTETTLPDGTVTIAFTMEAFPVDDPQADPFAGWTYAPLVGMFTDAWIHHPQEDDPRIDWQLEEWGHGYHGEIEIPHLPTVHKRQHSQDQPLNVSDTFHVGNQSESLRLSGWFVDEDETPDPMNLSLETPAGEVVWSANETRFQDQAFNLDDVVHQADAGTWTLHLDVPAEVSFFLDIQEVWAETQTVDYR